MKKKGFTLIELLAVIVILAIIAVITVPKIADMISSSRKGGAEDSFYGTLKAAELGYAKALQSNNNLKDDTCTIKDSNIKCLNGTKIDVSGKVPETGKIVIDKNGNITGINLGLNGYKCSGTLSTFTTCLKDNEEYAANQLIKKTTTTGDGLYKNDLIDGQYFFRGENPNNFIKFNNELWRIISVEEDSTLKLIRNESLGLKPWDEAGYRSKKDNTFCVDPAISGCNVWSSKEGNFTSPFTKITGTVTQNASLNDYLNNDYYKSLSSEAKKLIVSKEYDVGFVHSSYESERTYEDSIKELKAIKWIGKVALINPYEYMRISLNSNCTKPWDASGSNKDNYPSPCAQQNYLMSIEFNIMWTIQAQDILKDTARNNLIIGSNTESKGVVGHGGLYSSGNAHTIPVVYINSDIKLIGSGTNSDPYIIK